MLKERIFKDKLILIFFQKNQTDKSYYSIYKNLSKLLRINIKKIIFKNGSKFNGSLKNTNMLKIFTNNIKI